MFSFFFVPLYLCPSVPLSSNKKIKANEKRLMKKDILKINCYLLVIFLILLSTFCESSSYLKIPAAIHLDTVMGGGVLSPETMIKKVREAGIKVAIITDKENNSLEYGLFPLRNLLKKKVQRGSINYYGADHYISEIERLNSLYPDMAILHGAETIPAYYWTGNPFSGLTVNNFHKNILVLGLEKAEDYKNLPTIGNKNTGKFTPRCLLNLWPASIIILGILGLLHKKSTIALSYNIQLSKKKRRLKPISILCLVIGIVFLINNYPFSSPQFDQYHGDNGALPYQKLINYVNSKGGLTFWSSPDIETSQYKIKPVTFNTPPYFHDLLATTGYTGFAVFAEGMKYSGKPGGIWDMALIQYINGARDKPVWAIGELDFENGNWMGETQTVIFIKEINKDQVLTALKTGKCYAVKGHPQKTKPVLENFQIWDDLTKEWIEMGETATVNKVTRIKISIEYPESDLNTLKIIREGKVIKTLFFKDTFYKTVEFDYHNPDCMTYYRIDLNSSLISNPIFVKM